MNNTKLSKKREKVIFQLFVDDEFINPLFKSSIKWNLLISFYTSESGNAENIFYEINRYNAGVFIWSDKLFGFIEMAAINHSKSFWETVDTSRNLEMTHFENKNY